MAEDEEIIDNSHEDKSDIGVGQRALAPKIRHPMEALLKHAGGTAWLKAGDVVEGTVMEKKGARLFIDLGPRGVGIIFGKEYILAQEIIKTLEPGAAVNAKVIDPDNEEGYVELSLKDAGEEQRWFDLQRMVQTGETLELPVLEANRGGLILEVKKVKGFLPASQLSSKHYPRVEGGDKEKIYEALQKLVGEALSVKVLDCNLAEQKLIFTEKGVDEAALRTALTQYKVGDEVEGEVTGVVDFGAFTKFDKAGLEGLIHISEIDWTLVEDPRSVLKPGDNIRAKIIDIRGDKVSLSLKALKEDPWKKIAALHKKGDVVRGMVTKFNHFGTFVEFGVEIHPARKSPEDSDTEHGAAERSAGEKNDTPPAGFSNGVQGLVHISEFGTETRMREELELGKEYEFKVLLIDPDEHRMSLGMIRQQEAAAPEISPEEEKKAEEEIKKADAEAPVES